MLKFIKKLIELTPADRAVLNTLNFKDPWIWLATWGGSGFLKPAPGTWGSLAALPVGIILYGLGGPVALGIATVLVTYYGVRAIARFQRQTGADDHGMIVVDEVAGQWIALLAAGSNPVLIVLSFLLFRFFDITKIWPANWCDQKLPGAWGVMSDDLIAGLYAFLIIMGIHYAGLT